MFDVATRRQLQRWCVKQKKKFLWVRQPATFIKLMKISVCYKKKEHDEHIFLLMLELFEAGNDAQCTFTQNEGKLFKKIPLCFFCVMKSGWNGLNIATTSRKKQQHSLKGKFMQCD